jgi:transposase
MRDSSRFVWKGVCMTNLAVERLDHLGIVAGVCQEIGLVEYFDGLDERLHARVSLGQAVLAMVLNGLGFSNRRLYLVPQFFAHKPVERLIGPGITPEDLNDDCLGRALDWLTAHDLTALFAGLAHQARRRFGVTAEAAHLDSTSFSVEGAYEVEEDEEEANETLIRITYGYSRDHRADLKQWQLSLATTTSGVPLGLQLLDGNASDRATLAQQVAEVVYQFRAEGEEEPIYVADSALYTEATMTDLERKGVWWISRVPETSTQAKALVAEEPTTWQETEALRWCEREMRVGERTERWILAQSAEGVERQRASLQRKAAQEQQRWAKHVRALEQRTFACEADALSACAEARKGAPAWLEVTFQVASSTHYAGRGRPSPDALPELVWRVYGAVRLVETTLEEEARRKASFIVASNVPSSQKSAEEVLRVYKAQSGVERGFAFLKDPLFLASSVFVKKVERVMATGFIMVLCLLVYRLAEHRIRQRLAETGATVPDQLNKPTQRPTLRWLFQCFEGINLVLIRHEAAVEAVQVTGLTEVHQLILGVLGPAYEQFYESSK